MAYIGKPFLLFTIKYLLPRTAAQLIECIPKLHSNLPTVAYLKRMHRLYLAVP